MRRILIAVLAVIVAWFLFKDLVYESMTGKTDAAPAEPDYYYAEAWLERPAEAPPGGWETPWGVDIFLIAPPVTRPAPAGLLAASLPELEEEYSAFGEQTGADRISSEIYAPSYRSPSPASSSAERTRQMETAASDVRRAFKRYLAADNRDRGLIIFSAPGAEPILSAVLEDVPDNAEFRMRFGGIIVSAGANSPALDEAVGTCSDAFESCTSVLNIEASPSALRFFVPNLRKPQLAYSSTDDVPVAVQQRIDALSGWLDLNAVKPAEPFDTWAADEVVDVAPIRRPNQDEDISGERGD